MRSASSYGAAAATPALLLLDGNGPDELLVILPFGSYSPRESLEYAGGGKRYLLEPCDAARTGGRLRTGALSLQRTGRRLTGSYASGCNGRLGAEGLDHGLVRFGVGAADQVEAVGHGGEDADMR